MNEPGVEWYQAVCRRTSETADRFTSLNITGRITWPIPFFGRLQEATVVTVGVNPSSEEFADSRWADTKTEHQAYARLRNYFEVPPRTPHAWFETWETALNQIGASYYLGRMRHCAAHIDISPRATRSMGQLAADPSFCEMLKTDLRIFAETLSLAVCSRLALVAGAATKTHYVNEFLGEFLGGHGWRFCGEFSRTSGSGKVGKHLLKSDTTELPVFFCSSSPSDRRRPSLLVKRIAEHAEMLRDWLKTKA